MHHTQAHIHKHTQKHKHTQTRNTHTHTHTHTRHILATIVGLYTTRLLQLNARLNYANAVGKLERHKDAVAAYHKVLEMQPSHRDAINKMAFFAIRECLKARMLESKRFTRMGNLLFERKYAGACDTR